MRITADIDYNNPLRLAWSLIKGIYICKKFPSRIRMTEKGFHIIWKNVNANSKQALIYRAVIGDDRKRINLDMEHGRIKQVLFTEKKTICFGFIHRKWIKSKKHSNICPKCNKEVIKSEKIWEEGEKVIKIYHKNNICQIPLRRRFYG